MENELHIILDVPDELFLSKEETKRLPPNINLKVNVFETIAEAVKARAAFIAKHEIKKDD